MVPCDLVLHIRFDNSRVLDEVEGVLLDVAGTLYNVPSKIVRSDFNCEDETVAALGGEVVAEVWVRVSENIV